MAPPLLGSQVRLVISDVDETLADNYQPAKPAVLRHLERLLGRGVRLFLVTGQSHESVHERIVRHLTPLLRQRILVGACNGSEVRGYAPTGRALPSPLFSRPAEVLHGDHPVRIRAICREVEARHHLRLHPTMPFAAFARISKGDPHAIMHEDRRIQLTYELPNAVGTAPDLREAFMTDLNARFRAERMPVSARKAGTVAVDICVTGVTKGTAVAHALHTPGILDHLGLRAADLADPWALEVWGDRFSGDGADGALLEALDPQVRAIDFRPEPAGDLPPGRHIVLWGGPAFLHDGLQDYLARSEAALEAGVAPRTCWPPGQDEEAMDRPRA